MMNQERYPELRAALRDLFKRFPDEYFRKIDDARAYPEAVSYTHLTLPTNREV